MAVSMSKCGKGFLQLITKISRPLKQICSPAIHSVKSASAGYRKFSSFHLNGSPVESTSAPYIGSTNVCRKSNTAPCLHRRSLLEVCTPYTNTIRTRVSYSRREGKPKSVRAVVSRFYRLDWGIWIRRRAGYSKRLWKKHSARKYRLRQHVFCNKQQSKLLDKMVCDHWKKPRHFVNEPYEVYQKRTNMNVYFPERPPFVP